MDSGEMHAQNERFQYRTGLLGFTDCRVEHLVGSDTESEALDCVWQA